MNEIELDLHDEESSFDTEIESLDIDFEMEDEEEVENNKELIFYRRLDDF